MRYDEYIEDEYFERLGEIKTDAFAHECEYARHERIVREALIRLSREFAPGDPQRHVVAEAFDHLRQMDEADAELYSMIEHAGRG